MGPIFVPDSFGGQWSAPQVATLFEGAMAGLGVFLDSHPMSDGGEGLIDALLAHGSMELHGFEVTGPETTPVFATAGRRDGVWWVESAEAIGLNHTSPSTSPLTRSSYGLGSLIAGLAQRHGGPLMVGLGGVGTVDGGLGALQALGLTATDMHGSIIESPATGSDLNNVRALHGEIRFPNMLLRVLADVRSTVEHAAPLYGPQKGLQPNDIPPMVDALRRWMDTLNQWRDSHGREPVHPATVGGGAAGGLGFALAAIGGTITGGAQQFAKLTGLAKRIEHADVIIIGEGRLDATSYQGKVAGTVLEMAHKAGRPVVALVGQADHVPAPPAGPSEVIEINGVEARHIQAAASKLAALLS
jgi:glycerate kinase